MKEKINSQFREQEGTLEGQEKIDPKLQLKKMGIPEGVFPEPLFQDKEMLEFVLEQLPSIKSEAMIGSLTGTEVLDEERGVQENTGASKILFKAMDRAIYFKKPELARRIVGMAGFNLDDVRHDIWNEFMMTRINSLGWEYFYEVGKAFGIETDKINKTIIRSIEHNLPHGDESIIEMFSLFLEHGGSHEDLPADLKNKATQRVSTLLRSGKREEADRLAKIFELSSEQKDDARKQAIDKLTCVINTWWLTGAQSTIELKKSFFFSRCGSVLRQSGSHVVVNRVVINVGNKTKDFFIGCPAECSQERRNRCFPLAVNLH